MDDRNGARLEVPEKYVPPTSDHTSLLAILRNYPVIIVSQRFFTGLPERKEEEKDEYTSRDYGYARLTHVQPDPRRDQ